MKKLIFLLLIAAVLSCNNRHDSSSLLPIDLASADTIIPTNPGLRPAKFYWDISPKRIENQHDTLPAKFRPFIDSLKREGVYDKLETLIAFR